MPWLQILHQLSGCLVLVVGTGVGINHHWHAGKYCSQRMMALDFFYLMMIVSSVALHWKVYCKVQKCAFQSVYAVLHMEYALLLGFQSRLWGL